MNCRFMNSLGNKRVELFDMGAGVSEPTADDNVQMASGKFLSFCISVSLVWLCKDELSPPSVCFIILAVDYPMLVSLALLWSVQCKCESNFEKIKLLGTLCLYLCLFHAWFENNTFVWPPFQFTCMSDSYVKSRTNQFWDENNGWDRSGHWTF